MDGSVLKTEMARRAKRCSRAGVTACKPPCIAQVHWVTSQAVPLNRTLCTRTAAARTSGTLTVAACTQQTDRHRDRGSRAGAIQVHRCCSCAHTK